MAGIYNVAIKADRMTATRDAFAGGTLELLDGATVISTHTLSATGGTVSGAVWTLAFLNATVDAGASGTVDGAQLKTSGGDAHYTGLTVGTSGTDIVIQNTSINSGQPVTFTSATVTHAA